MSNTNKKIECVRRSLIEDFEIGLETNKGFNKETNKLDFQTRTIDQEKICKDCDVTNGQLSGILELLKEEDFIVGDGRTPIYNNSGTEMTGDFAIQVYFHKDKNTARVVSDLPEVYFDLDSGVGTVDRKRFTLKQGGNLFKLFSFLYEFINQNVGYDDILSILDSTDTPKSDATRKINEIVKNLRRTTGLSKDFIVNKGGIVILRAEKPKLT